jgi:hypothetical protein
MSYSSRQECLIREGLGRVVGVGRGKGGKLAGVPKS